MFTTSRRICTALAATCVGAALLSGVAAEPEPSPVPASAFQPVPPPATEKAPAAEKASTPEKAPEPEKKKTPNTYAAEGSRARKVDWFDGRPTETISLERTIEQLLKNNLEVQFERVGINVQRAQIKFAAGVFDPVFSVQSQYQA